MNPLDRLLAIEAIKNVKARYWYCMDMKDWDGLRAVFTDDAIFDMRSERAFSLGQSAEELPSVEQAITAGDDAVVVGAEAIAIFIRTVVESWTTVHHGHAPIIEITGPHHGTAIWPLFDYIDDGTRAIKGYGHYHEEYRRVDERWLISRVLLTRIRADGDYPRADRLQQ
jgi:SnoaL-like domain